MKSALLLVCIFLVISAISGSSVSVSVSVGEGENEYNHNPYARQHFANKFHQVDDSELDAATATSAHVLVYMFYGAGGYVTSHGMDLLAQTIQSLDKTKLSVVNPIHSWTDWRSVVADIKTRPTTAKIILIGYSMGANSVTFVADALQNQQNGRTVDLLISYDPSIWYPAPVPLLGNIKKAICYHNTFIINAVGLAKLTPGTGFNPKNYEQINISEEHRLVDYDQNLHKVTLAAIKAILATA